MDAERLTVEMAKKHFEFLEVCQSAPFRWDLSGELVGVAKVVAKVEHLEWHWELLGQFTCKK